MISLVLIIFLVPLCTIYAFKTRKIPENFNEAKYIGFTMYSTCIVFLASIAIYFGTSNDYKIQSSSLCMCLNISATVVLACLFSPKVYLVLFQPYKNIRPRNNGGRCAPPGASGSSGGATGVSGCEMVSSSKWVWSNHWYPTPTHEKIEKPLYLFNYYFCFFEQMWWKLLKLSWKRHELKIGGDRQDVPCLIQKMSAQMKWDLVNYRVIINYWVSRFLMPFYTPT